MDDRRPSRTNSELQRAEAALQDSNELVRLLLDSTAEAIIGIDRTGRCTFCNAACVGLLGFASPSDLLKHDVHELIRFVLPNGEPYTQDRCRIHRLLLDGKGVHADDELLLRKDGTSFAVEYWCYPLRRQDEIIGVVLTFLDISQRRKLEAELRQAQKMDAIGRLAGGLAHDFNNLLMVISAYAELMQDELPPGDKLRKNTGEILGASRRAAELTRQLLAFGRKQMQALQVLDVNSVIRQIGKILPRLIGEDIQLVITAGKDLAKVKADPVQLEQIVMNLAANSRDAMPDGGKLIIETSNAHLDDSYIERRSMVPAGNYVLLSITDSGHGIAPEALAHIFEPFFTTKAEGKGTGLGLATVYGIVKQNGGFVWAYSEPGLGTTFKIYWPALAGKQDLQPSADPSLEYRGGSETVLLVEDAAAVRQPARDFLSSIGYTVLEAGNGEEALTVARRYPGPIHMMVSDVVMPQMGGVQVAQQLSAERPQMKVLFVSGYAENTVLRHGAIDVQHRFLAKPFTLRTLARKIREVLEAKAALAASSGDA
jgi:two-component system cell cycle sensor histidine kinase/response regulator CckA